MDTLNVAFIDDGIHKGSLLSENHTLYHYVLNNEGLVEVKEAGVNPISHGTMCAKTFIEFAPNCNIYDIHIPITKNNNMNPTDINIAFKWCIDNEIQMISMSLGALTIENMLELTKNIEQLEKKGIVLVATCSNTNKVTYPASLQNVIGVRYNNTVLKNGEYYYLEKSIDGIDVITSLPEKQPLNFYKDKYGIDIQLTNSFATSYFASKICFLLKQGMSFNCIKKELKRNSKKLDFNLYSYYEKYIINFQPSDLIDVPIIGVLKDGKVKNNICKKLQRIFIDKGYICGLIDNKDSISSKNFSKLWLKEYNISLGQLVTLVINSNVLDILLISLDEYELKKMLSVKTIDLILMPITKSPLLDCENIINYSTEYNLESIFNEIIDVFKN